MDPRELTTLVTGAANALSCRLCTEEMEVLAAVLTQLGDTLATLAAQRRLLEARCEREKRRAGA